ncbi:hypothetical protein NFI96_017190 [Prochilodus magdalenae]|nr:hypothetical protein NFI96_017190 [Prochilodus magdalenae]
MKVLLIFTLYLISGPVSCSDVIGYLGGAVIIYCNPQKNGVNNTYYFCKTTTKECIEVQTSNTLIHKDRISLLHLPGYSHTPSPVDLETLVVIYRRLSVQDSGLYQCGDTGGWSHDLKLTVERDSCCLGPRIVAGHPGETVTIYCSYPEQYKEDIKFSISDNEYSKVFTVRISDVREDDGGVYYCGVSVGEESIGYISIHSEIQLRVTARTSPTKKPTPARTSPPKKPTPARTSPPKKPTPARTSPPKKPTPARTSPPKKPTPARTSPTKKPTPARTSPPEKPGNESYSTTPSYGPTFDRPTAPRSVPSDKHSSSSIIIITVCVCVVLLLIGGSALVFYRLRCRRTQVSALSRKRPGRSKTDDGDYEIDPLGNQNHISMSPVYQNIKTKPTQPVYESLTPNTNQSDSVYQSLTPTTNQSDSVYQSLTPTTNQSDSVYQSLTPNTKQSDSVYQSLNRNTN